MNTHQFGFTEGCRTSDNVFIIDTLISFQKSKNNPLYIAFIDFSKAFDFVNRTFLYHKLIKKGFGGRLLKVIQSMFSKSHARVRWQGELGSELDSTYGVLQGGIISPRLFNLYLSDMHEFFDDSHGINIGGYTIKHLLYADDLVLVSESPSNMQSLLNSLSEYCKKWHLLINSAKSKVMIFPPNGRKKSVENDLFFFNNDALENVTSYKYLGHIISNSRRTHSMMYDHLATKAQCAMHALKERIKSTVGYLPPTISIKMFDTHILPILDYNSEIWFMNKQIDILEKIQIKFLKSLLGVRSQTSSIAVLGDTGRFPLIYRQQVSAIKYLDRLTSSDCPRLLSSCLDIQLSLSENDFPCWLSRLNKLINNLNINEKEISAIILKLYEHAHNSMLADMRDTTKFPKLRTYSLIKTELCFEKYLNYNLPKCVYQSIARFRLSSHNLYIELGRHKRPYIPAELRICKRCDLNVIEDEYHCIISCSKWKDPRDKLLQVVLRFIDNFCVLAPHTQFIEIMTNKNRTIIYELGKFLDTILKVDNIV